MNVWIVVLLAVSQMFYAKITIQNIEENGINKNSFLCTSATIGDVIVCKDAQSMAHGYDISQGKTLQLSNNQQYWLQQEVLQSQYDTTVLGYTNDGLVQKLQKDGWSAMGGFCLIVTTDPLITSVVMPTVTATSGQTKIVVQLWYNGGGVIQLWSQDAVIVSDGASISIALSDQVDSRLTTLTRPDISTASVTWKTTFLKALDIQPDNRQSSDYTNAVGSPRHVRIIVA
ncbi:hypothetical protein KBD08_03215 [Candidatus Babeliales bacterium]|nr:hypothetical protein [Candidatus Babeliales bacterium]